MKFHEAFRQLRLQKGVSEDQIASVLGVSYKEIVRWESGKESPPLSLLPRIALYFSCSTDDLLGMGDLQPEELLAPYLEKYQRYLEKEMLPEAIATVREGLLHFPDSDKLKWMLLYALCRSCTRPAVVKHYTAEIFAVAEDLLEHSRDDAIRLEARRLLCRHAYEDLKDPAKALSIAKSLPPRASCREDMLIRIAEGDTKKQLLRQTILSDTRLLADEIALLAQSEEASYPLYREDLHAAIALLRLLFSEGDALQSAPELLPLLCDLGLRELQNGDTDAGFTHFQEAAELAKQYDALPEETVCRSPLLQGLRYRKPEKPASARRAMLSKLAPVSGMEQIRYDPRLKALLETITEDH